MKKLLLIVCLILPAMSLHAKAVQEDYKGADERTRVSYSFGMLFGSNLQDIDIEIDYAAFTEGLRATLEKAETQFTQQEAMENVETAIQVAMDKKTEEYKIKEEAFLSTNMARPEVKVTPSGLQYEVLVDTTGEKPDKNDAVKVNYVGTFTDGSPFDSSDEDDGAVIPLNLVIPGWTEGLTLMSVGSKYKFFIPSKLAYGRDGVNSVIPPYATLVFTVELLEIINENSSVFDGLNSGE